MNEIVAATGNTHKIEEIGEILRAHDVQVIHPDDVGGMPDVQETGVTFVENATLKAKALADKAGCFVLADDSGLVVDALDGRPGVHSARYAGPNSTASDLMAKVLAEMPAGKSRRARFVCVIAVAGPDGLVGTAEGQVDGLLATEPQGEGGFGYDPIFIPDGYDNTFAELGADIKSTLSHRARALVAAVDAGLFHAH